MIRDRLKECHRNLAAKYVVANNHYSSYCKNTKLLDLRNFKQAVHQAIICADEARKFGLHLHDAHRMLQDIMDLKDMADSIGLPWSIFEEDMRVPNLRSFIAVQETREMNSMLALTSQLN